MKHVVNIVATCTDRKRIPPAKSLRLRHVKSHDIGSRAKEWQERLSSHFDPKDACRAVDLYHGVYWANVRRLVEDAASLGYAAKLWIASAGYGLLSADTTVMSYSATFASGSEDSVTTSGTARDEDRKTWWALLQRRRPHDSRVARSLQDVADMSPSGSICLFGSPDYLNAMADDVWAARRRLTHPRRFVAVCSAGGVRAAEVQSALVENDARLTHHFGGALVSLHVRTARYILSQAKGGPLDVNDARTQVATLLAKQPSFSRPVRRELSDDGVRAFIRKALAENPAAKASPLLRALRAANWRCEQKRFKQLYFAEVGEDA